MITNSCLNSVRSPPLTYWKLNVGEPDEAEVACSAPIGLLVSLAVLPDDRTASCTAMATWDSWLTTLTRAWYSVPPQTPHRRLYATQSAASTAESVSALSHSVNTNNAISFPLHLIQLQRGRITISLIKCCLVVIGNVKQYFIFFTNIKVLQKYTTIIITSTRSHGQLRSDVWTAKSYIFTTLHWMQGGLVRRKLSVCPSVCLSNVCIVTKRKKRSVHIIYTIRMII